MPAPLTILIPTLNAADSLPATLASLEEGLFAGVIRQLVLTDGGSTDATHDIAEAAGADLVTGAAGRGGQLARGAAAAKGEWLLVMHADTRLARGWSDVVAEALTAPERAHYFRLRFDARGTAPAIVARWANLRARLFGLPYGDQGLLIHRDLYDRVGGYPDQPLMEDVAIARALRGHLAEMPHIATTSAARYLAEGWLRQGARNLWLLARYLGGADPHRLARAYGRN